MQASKKTQYWFSIDHLYMAMTATLPFVEGVETTSGNPTPRQGMTFAITEPALDGVTFQLTKKDKLGISAPEGVELERVIEVFKPYLDRAAGKPVRLTPLISPPAAASKREGDLELVGNTQLAIALGRCYDLLFDLNYVLSMTFRKSVAEDTRRVRERLIVVRNLLLKYNLALKREELESEEKKTFAISLKDLLSGGVWWGKRFVKRGLKDRYQHLLSLAKELPEGPVRDEVFSSLSLFSEVGAKLDEGLRGLDR